MTDPVSRTPGQPQRPEDTFFVAQTPAGSPFDPVASGLTVTLGAPGHGAAARTEAGSRTKALIAILAALAVLLTVGAAYAGVTMLSGGGTQPEDVLPGNTVAFIKIDLDPAIGQKIALARLASRFPNTQGASEANIKDQVLAAAFEDNEQGLNYTRDIKPWIGNRVALAAVPAPVKDGVAPVLAVEFTDETKMTAALTKAGTTPAPACDNDPMSGACADPERIPQFGFAVRDDYVLISDTQANADRAATDTTSLSANPMASRDAAGLDGDQIAVGWADLGALYAAVPKDRKSMVADQIGAIKPSGRFVVGLHAGSDYVEVKGRGHGLQMMAGQSRLAATPGTDMIAKFPAGVLGAGSVTGLDRFLTDFWNEYVKHDSFGIQEQATDVGLRLPQDFGALFGTETAFAATADQHFGVRVLTGDPGRAQHILALGADLGTKTVAAVNAPGGYAASDDPGFAAALAKNDGTLGDTEQFMRAVPDANKASGLLYLNLAQILESTGDRTAKHDWSALGSLGVTTSGGTDQTVTLRLTTR
jgi:Protein of unknown function (DUF3352)